MVPLTERALQPLSGKPLIDQMGSGSNKTFRTSNVQEVIITVVAYLRSDSELCAQRLNARISFLGTRSAKTTNTPPRLVLQNVQHEPGELERIAPEEH